MSFSKNVVFDGTCQDCPRLDKFIKSNKKKYPDYFNAPVPPTGEDNIQLLIVGLAPGLHGANATGRPFTGDYAGVLLYKTLFDFGYSSQPDSISRNDGLVLTGCRITNAVKCVPPQNKPTTEEIKTCNQFLKNEISSLRKGTVILALGLIAHQAILRSLNLTLSAFPFSHLAEFKLSSGHVLLSSYHCSRYNTQTKRLTPQMFNAVFQRIKILTSQ